jgi:hypothetical protein
LVKLVIMGFVLLSSPRHGGAEEQSE